MMNNTLLNQYQKASLATVLRMFEEDLRQADSWLDGRQVEGILYRQRLTISPARRAAARKRIAAALNEIATLAGLLDLGPEIDNPAGLIRSQMSIAWANLLDSQSVNLKRFGEVQPEVAMEIDPHVQRLAQAALGLAKLFENNSSNPVSSGTENLTEV